MQPFIAVDGTHLKGRFEGTMFIATTQDLNEQVYPIAFGYGDSKNNLSWEWFLECLKDTIGHIDDLVFISDRHMEELRNLHQNAYDYANDAGPHKWSRVHYPERRERNFDFTSLCTDYYKREKLIDVYSVPIMPVGHPSSWVVPTDIVKQVVLNPMSRRKSGRSRVGRHVSSSERTTTQMCRRCGQSSHNSMRCSNPHLINVGVSRVVPSEYRRKCSICHSIRHNKQTCSEKKSTVV
ncbi:hypothetical protein Ddye_005486 [Dipteronia dyeriana]|uniref:MULE transposase domain-containing protein n=1 Tax=Dipteronia dyeriana TaxID=168575 RepID=A0AAD9XGK2_9ROSI|nr:hypothetical protein Ddye_005486 [Dipteronia dyeriana]